LSDPNGAPPLAPPDLPDPGFLVRHRMPRPISRAFEVVSFALDPEDERHRAQWCAKVTLRLLAALRQAADLAQAGGGPVNPPELRQAGGRGGGTFPEDLPSSLPFGLQRLAGIYGAPVRSGARGLLSTSLAHLAPLARYRIAVLEDQGLRLLLGPRIEVGLPWAFGDGGSDVPRDEPLLVDPRDGRYLSLAPLLAWVRDLHQGFGHLYLLRRIEGGLGHYVEEGIPGCPSHACELRGRPSLGVLPLDAEALAALASPPARFRDGARPSPDLEVRGLIWRGGTSDVFAARPVGEPGALALKTFEYPGVFDENFWRFRNEEIFARDVQHPAVVAPKSRALEGYGTVLQQRLVVRGSLQDLLDSSGVLAVDQAVSLCAGLLDALQAVHDAGVAHNDIKPDNLLVDEDGTLALIDFGIAARLDHKERGLRPGAPPGSRGFMAPELRQGGAPSVASDLFALGAILLAMVSGRGIEDGEDPLLRPEVGAELRSFLAGCLASRPEDRFRDARGARAALEALAPSLRPARGISLDIEGTLVRSFSDPRARPGLRDFLSFVLERFDRVFVYTMLDEGEAAQVFASLAAAGELPDDFLGRYEYVHWPRGEGGALKDLRRCRLPLGDNALVDDTEAVVPEDQRHRWVPVPDFGASEGYDRGLFLARATLRQLFGLAEG